METIMTENERKLRYVIEKHRDTVYKVAYSYCKNSSDSDDIFQEVFFRFLKTNLILMMKNMRRHGLFVLQ